jgi:Ca2+-binding EF-hand superfamily protein
MAMRPPRKGSFGFDADEFPKLTRSDFDKIKDLFRRYDYNGAGNIKKPELLDILKGKTCISVAYLTLCGRYGNITD